MSHKMDARLIWVNVSIFILFVHEGYNVRFILFDYKSFRHQIFTIQRFDDLKLFSDLPV